jgi:cytochrome c peroxidase
VVPAERSWTAAGWWRGLAAASFAVSLTACAPGPSRAALDADNPVRPSSPPPFGLEEFFADAPPPVPERARLGRWLFYDTRLSADSSVACVSCHRPTHAFSEPLPVSIGVGGARGRRKAPTLQNLAARTTLVDTPDRERGDRFFWDGRVDTLERQVLIPIADPAEMGMDHRALLERVGRIRGYRPYFQRAFGSEDATLDRVAVALADYVRTLKNGNAPYDRWRYGGDGRAMSAQAKRGSDIFFFRGRCAMCHAGFNFSDGRFHNLGVGWNTATRSFSDEGRALVTGEGRDRGAFKTPGLRDVSKHAPYMHDGSLATLRDVVAFYNRGGDENPWQSRRLAPLGLAAAEIDALIAFLESLDSDRAAADGPPRLFPR